MRQQKYEQALKEARSVLLKGELTDMPYSAIADAIEIIDRVLHRPAASDMTEHERGASVARDVANNYSGQ